MLRFVPGLTITPGGAYSDPVLQVRRRSCPFPHTLRHGAHGIQTSVCDTGKPHSHKPLAWRLASGKPFPDAGLTTRPGGCGTSRERPELQGPAVWPGDLWDEWRDTSLQPKGMWQAKLFVMYAFVSRCPLGCQSPPGLLPRPQD